jgi:predicted phage terminase large subunit-like protein
MIASYSASKARDHGLAVKEDLPTLDLHDERKGASHFQLTQGGGLLCTGIGGASIGRGYDLGIIDDPHKNYDEAHSDKKLQTLYRWLSSTFRDRAEPGASIVICMHRWNDKDLCAFALDEMGAEGWDVINMPAIAGEYDQLGRQPGEALLPERYTVEDLEKVRQVIHFLEWNAKFQQQPIKSGGNLWLQSWFRFYKRSERPQHFDLIALSWDCTSKETSDGSYVVGQTWGLVGPRKYLLEQFRQRVGIVDTLVAMKAMIERWSPEIIWIEDAANGQPIVELLVEQIAGVVPVKARGSKTIRAIAAAPDIQTGCVYLPDPKEPGNEWVNDYLKEVTNFPNAKTDDQVDATSQSINQLRKFSGEIHLGDLG